MNKPTTTDKGLATPPPVDRRKFLSTAGLAVAAGALLLSGCKDDDDETPAAPVHNDPNAPEIKIANDEKGLMNLVYVLEQLQAGFFTKVTQSFAPGFSGQEQELFTDMRNQQLAHAGLLKELLGPDAQPDAILKLDAIDFNSRSSVLSFAKTQANLAESGYNGLMPYLKEAANIELLSKMVSVEARQAAYIHNLIQSGSFANLEVVDPNGLAKLRQPFSTVAIADPYIWNAIDHKLSELE